jgi:zinc transporter ZupT
MAAVAVHKLPEAFAYGAILRAALTNNWKTYVFALGLQASMLIGVGLHRHFALSLDPVVLEVALTLAGGMFLYLGGHAVHAEWRRRVTSHTHA